MNLDRGSEFVMKPETKQPSPGFSLIVEVVITSGHRKHGSGTFQKFYLFLKGKSTMCMITDTLGIAVLELQSQQSSRILPGPLPSS